MAKNNKQKKFFLKTEKKKSVCYGVLIESSVRPKKAICTLFNPNNSNMAIEGILSPDGRVISKMGHSERYNNGLYKNVYGNYDMKLFESAVKYFK